jgi:hypothetical protein
VYRPGGDKVSLPGGARYQVEFQPVAGQKTPAPQPIDLAGGQAATARGTYLPSVIRPVVSTQLAVGLVGRTFTYPVRATGSPTGYSITGALPQGLTFNTRTGVLSGSIPENAATGRFTLSVVAASGGLASAPGELILDILFPSDLLVSQVGLGSVTRGFSGKSTRGIGQQLTITATPGRGYIFQSWSGDASSTTPKVTFVMGEASSLLATFILNPYPKLVGSYQALLSPAAENTGPITAASYGRALLSVSATGRVTGRLFSGGKSYVVVAQLNGFGQGAATIRRQGLGTLTVQLALDLSGPPVPGLEVRVLDETTLLTGATAVRGVRTLAETGVADLKPGVFRLLATLPAPPAGVEVPPLPAKVNFTLLKTGRYVWSGYLADGTRLSFAGVLAPDGTATVYAPLYAGAGVLTASATFQGAPPATLAGTGHWFRPVITTAKTYRVGWPAGLIVAMAPAP